MLTTASFYQPEHHIGNLFRISVGYPRGQRRAWVDLPFLYPARDIVQAYRSNQLTAGEYRQRYLALLHERWPRLQEWLNSLAADTDLTLLCFEPEGQFCHRQVVAELVRQHRPDIPVVVH